MAEDSPLPTHSCMSCFCAQINNRGLKISNIIIPAYRILLTRKGGTGTDLYLMQLLITSQEWLKCTMHQPLESGGS